MTLHDSTSFGVLKLMKTFPRLAVLMLSLQCLDCSLHVGLPYVLSGVVGGTGVDGPEEQLASADSLWQLCR